jgi:hypothetical protein
MARMSEIAANVELCEKNAEDLRRIGDFKHAEMWMEAAKVWERMAE